MKLPLSLLIAASLALVTSAACGDEAGPGSQSVDELSANPCGSCPEEQFCSHGRCVVDPSLADGSLEPCDRFGFTPTNQAAFARRAGGQTRLRYVASNVVTQPPFDKLVVELVHSQLFPDGPAARTFDLDGAGVRGAPLFLRGHTFCNDFDCAFTFIAEGGTLELDEPGFPGSPLRGTFRDLRLKQVRIDAQSGAIIPFSRGQVWCLGDYRLREEIPELSEAKGFCVEEGTGDRVGDNVRNFTLQSCTGEWVDLHERCGQSKALWLVATAGWCGACETFVPVAAQRHAQLADQGLDLMVVIGEDGFSGPPSLEYCMTYALAKGLDPANVFIDHDGRRSWPELFGAIETYSGGSIGLPWNAVLDGVSMEYIWSSNAGTGDLYSVQDQLLAGEDAL